MRDRAVHERVLIAVCREIGPGIGSVSVRVEQGIGQVSGVVDTPAEYTAVEHAIWGIPEVRGVAQRLRVRRTFEGGPTDTTLAEDVLGALEREGRNGYRVHVQEGAMTVRGVRGVWTADDLELGSLAEQPKPSFVSRIRTVWN